MKPIEKTVTKNQVELKLHLIDSQLSINADKKIIFGTIQSFKTDSIIEASGERGYPVPALTTQFQLTVQTFDNLIIQVENYVEANIDKIATA